MAGCILLLAPLALVSGVVPVVIPLATDDQLSEYEAVAQTLPVEVDWMAMVAIDAVRNQQDFSNVNTVKIMETAALFFSCTPVVKTYEIPFEGDAVGDNIQQALPLSHPAEVSWEAHHEQGAVDIVLRDSLDQPVSPGKLDAGFYSLLIVATEAPAVYQVDLYVESEELICQGKPVEQVMDELGFTGEEREMAMGFINTLADSGP